MTYRRYATYREALEKRGSDGDFNRRVHACAECHMHENYAELCSVHAKEAGWGPYGQAETLMEKREDWRERDAMREIFAHVEGRVFCPGCGENVSGTIPEEHDCSLALLR